VIVNISGPSLTPSLIGLKSNSARLLLIVIELPVVVKSVEYPGPVMPQNNSVPFGTFVVVTVILSVPPSVTLGDAAVIVYPGAAVVVVVELGAAVVVVVELGAAVVVVVVVELGAAVVVVELGAAVVVVVELGVAVVVVELGVAVVVVELGAAVVVVELGAAVVVVELGAAVVVVELGAAVVVVELGAAVVVVVELDPTVLTTIVVATV